MGIFRRKEGATAKMRQYPTMTFRDYIRKHASETKDGFEGKEKELAERMKEHGYTLYRVKHFKNFDRIHFGNEYINISLNLRGKLSELALETLIEACIGTPKQKKEGEGK